MEPEEVKGYIEAPYIGVVPTEPGLTNVVVNETNGEKVIGMNTEFGKINEGEVFFDVLFYVRTVDRSAKIIIDMEAQKDEPSGYDIEQSDILCM